jgi:hypothetical protein
VVEGDRTYFDSPSDGLLLLCTTIFIKMGEKFNKKISLCAVIKFWVEPTHS